MRVTRDSLVAVLNVDPTTVHLAPGFTLDLRGVGHLGTGDLEIRIASADELNRAEVAASFAAAV